jgi:sirohydrochlorin cobaltochelatase
MNRGAADWLQRAITIENVSVRSEGLELDLPAGPSCRPEMEIKNVITVMAKTTHYQFGHVIPVQRSGIRNLLRTLEEESPLLQPASLSNAIESQPNEAVREKMSETIHQLTGLRTSSHRYSGWLGIEYPDVHSEIWMMRAMIASNVF